MELFLFIVFVAVCAVLLCRLINKPEKDLGKVRPERPGTETRERQLKTPAVCTLARPDELWQSRLHRTTKDDSKAFRRAPESGPEELEYDGYSRRDRHHVAETRAHIKEEGHLEDPAAGRDKDWGEQGLAH